MIRPSGARIGLWIDQELDTGHGLPEEICREVIQLRGEDPLHYAVQGGIVLGIGLDGMVLVPENLEEKAIEAAEEQPEENIYLEYVQELGGEIVGIFERDGSISEWQRGVSVIPEGVNIVVT
jgi:hypothetical protein